MFARVPAPGWVVSALLAVQVLFGINYVVSKVLVDAFPPLVWACGRVAIAAAVMVAVALAAGRRHPSGGVEFFGPLLIFTLLGVVVNQGSFLVGLKHTTATNSAILNTLIPIFTLLLVTLRGQEPVTVKGVVGFASACLGVLVLRRVEAFTLTDATLVGDLLTILNAFSFALFLAFGKRFLETHDRVWVTAWMFVFGSLGLGIVALPDFLTFRMPEVTTGLALGMAFNILGATVLTYFLNAWALAHAKSSQVALYIYLQPVVASAVAWIWMGETITARTVLSSALIFLGLLLALQRGRGGAELVHRAGVEGVR